MLLLWVCQSSKCGYQEVAVAAHYYGWCGQDLLPLCITCHRLVDHKTGFCATCDTSFSKNSRLEEKRDNAAKL